ncbi:MAG: TolC family protein [Planctomycetes bacterium]|nr:TolC family protein [Planctomycetota bacterium]
MSRFRRTAQARFPARGLTAAGVLAAALAGWSLASCAISRPMPALSYVGPVRSAASGGGAAAPTGEAVAAATPGAAPSPAAGAGPIEVSVQDAVLMAIENNQELVVERMNPAIARTFEQEERGVFDPLLTGTFGWQRARGENLSSRGRLYETRAESLVGEAGITARLPTGTTVGAGASSEVVDAAGDGRQLVQSRVGLTVTQALLRGFGSGVNLASIRQARLDTLASEYELRGFAETVVAAVEQAYWDYVLAQGELEIYEQSAKLAEEQLKIIGERAQAGTIPATDTAAAESEIALRRQDMVDARSDREKARVRLLGLLNPPGTTPWGRPVRPLEKPAMPAAPLDDVESHVAVAMRMRPDLNQARLAVERGDLRIVKTRNGLLPRMDLFITLGRSGYAGSFSGASKDLDAGRHPDLMVGVSAEYALSNHEARAQHERAVVSRRQAEEAVRNLERLAQVDVRTAHIEAGRARDQGAAAAATRKLDEEKLRIEMDKFLTGRSSAFQVARAQRDLVQSRIAEATALVEHLQALVELYRLEGSLLERRGVSAPGDGPPKPRPYAP